MPSSLPPEHTVPSSPLSTSTNALQYPTSAPTYTLISTDAPTDPAHLTFRGLIALHSHHLNPTHDSSSRCINPVASSAARAASLAVFALPSAPSPVGDEHRDVEQAPGHQHADHRHQRGHHRGGQAARPQPGRIHMEPPLTVPSSPERMQVLPRSVAWCAASIWSVPDGSALLILGAPSNPRTAPGSLDRLSAVDQAAASRPPALLEGTGGSPIYRPIYRYECCRNQRMAIAPQTGGR
jgi:hypothetical protein